ncbi:MAG TPA: hypothetical protein VEG31_03475 [Thermoproteota archaeon]|nr:hypothetical protein [Thermoproteota archaeon]
MCSERPFNVIIAVCSRKTETGYVVTSFEECTLAVIVSVGDKRVLRTKSLVPTGSRPNLDKATELRQEYPTAVITSAIDPYSLVSLSAKGIEVRLVDGGVALEAALQLYQENRTRLACNVVRPTES